MKTFVKILLVMILSSVSLICYADRDFEIDKDSIRPHILPPANLPVESWELSYLPYYCMYYVNEGWLEDFLSRIDHIGYSSKTIDAVIDGDDIYFRGLVAWSSYSMSRNKSNADNIEMPTIWVKASLRGDSIIFDTSQLVCNFDYNGKTNELFLDSSVTTGDYLHGIRTTSYDTYSYPSTAPLKLIRKESEELKEYWAAPNEPDLVTYNGKKYVRGLTLMENDNNCRQVGNEYGEGPGMPGEWQHYSYYYGGKGLGIYSGIRLRKIDSGINVTLESVDDEAPYYDLQGRIYRQCPTSPGIYIHSGKKLIVR